MVSLLDKSYGPHDYILKHKANMVVFFLSLVLFSCSTSLMGRKTVFEAQGKLSYAYIYKKLVFNSNLK